jgi:hypothetical protein
VHDSQEHIFTNEFDDVCIAISLNLDTAAASVQITISDSECNSIWWELMPVSTDLHHKDTTASVLLKEAYKEVFRVLSDSPRRDDQHPRLGMLCC